ncbi:MAG: glycosyltransferase [Deltaproteobacteria bacterium]|nr:glycosyltransferase [Deltaproteobacteria bacterium]
MGPVAVGICKAQKQLGCNSVIWSLDSSSVVRKAAQTNGLNLKDVRSFDVLGPRRIGYSPSMEHRVLTQKESRFDIIHQHSIWLAISRVTNRWRDASSKPTVVAPHGTLEAYALKRSWWKKRLALWGYEMDNLTHAACLHATSNTEATSFRNFGLKNPIAVIPNGVPGECLKRHGDAARFRSRFSIPSDKRLLLFLSRIDPKKGLPLLFKAMKQLDGELEEWLLVIAGFEYKHGYRREIEQLGKRLKISKKIIFTGPLFGQDKDDGFAASDMLVLPTHSEGFGMIVVDALAAGVPVLTTHGAPWEELISHNCGWWAEINEQGICNALQDAVNRPKQELIEMGARGRVLVEERYIWIQVTKMTIELYRWLLGCGSTPSFVFKD